MSRQKRGGSRLDKNMPTKSKQTGLNENAATPVGKKKMATWKLVLLIIAAVLAAIILTVVILHLIFVNMAEVSEDVAPLPMINPVTGEQLPDNPMANAPRKKTFYTFLIAGRDTGGGGNTDTMMLVAYDIPNQKLSIMSIPRDTMVDARHPDRNRKLNGVWNLGLYYAKKDEKKEGIEYLKEAVGDMMGFVPDFYFVINWESFGRLVDAIGGVEFEVPFTMKYDDPTQNLHINVAAGKRVLTGKEAMDVVRWRHNNSGGGYATGDLGRIETQQALMKEVVKKCLKIENIPKFAEIFLKEVDTDLTVGNLIAFAERAILGGLKMENVIFSTMPNTAVYVGAESYVQAKPNELLGILNDGFNPYKEDIPMEALHILQYSSSRGYYVYSGTGTGTTPVYTNPKPATMVGGSEGKSSASPSPSDGPDASVSPESGASAQPSGSAAPNASTRPSSGANSSDTPDPSNAASRSPGSDPDKSDPPENRPEPNDPDPTAAAPEPTPTSAGPEGIPMD